MSNMSIPMCMENATIVVDPAHPDKMIVQMEVDIAQILDLLMVASTSEESSSDSASEEAASVDEPARKIATGTRSRLMNIKKANTCVKETSRKLKMSGSKLAVKAAAA